MKAGARHIPQLNRKTGQRRRRLGHHLVWSKHGGTVGTAEGPGSVVLELLNCAAPLTGERLFARRAVHVKTPDSVPIGPDPWRAVHTRQDKAALHPLVGLGSRSSFGGDEPFLHPSRPRACEPLLIQAGLPVGGNEDKVQAPGGVRGHSDAVEGGGNADSDWAQNLCLTGQAVAATGTLRT